MASNQTMEQMHLTNTKSVTFLCDTEIYNAIYKEADANFEGKFSMALRSILKNWKENPNA